MKTGPPERAGQMHRREHNDAPTAYNHIEGNESMNVQIVSIQAALKGGPPILWHGTLDPVEDLSLEHAVAPVEGEVNEALFRYFNRVDEADVDRLQEIGYSLPSLSVGDLISWGAKTWRVSGSGFECITDSNEYVMALTAYTLRTMSPDDEDRPTRAEIERGI